MRYILGMSESLLECHSADKPHNIVQRSNNALYKGADNSFARPTSRFILFDGYNISFDASLVLYI